MTKEIIVNAGEMESRVAILENGRLMELHVERDPKIVGSIYKGRVTKVLKGMDAAFVDIGIERNAFLAVSDVVPTEDDDAPQGNGRFNRASLPPITQLLKANQEILVQVVRAPMGTKGARVTTRLSLPGRYMVLMLNSGSHIGVSRKIDDHKERQRLRAIAQAIRPEEYSLIVRTEAEGRTEEELRQDLTFLLDMAGRIEGKAAHAPAASLVHGDLTLVFRLIRDAFTRDVNRLVVDSPTTYENVVEFVNLISPRLKNRVYLYEEIMPIFHAYNIEPEIERMLRRKVWLPSGGSLIIDQAEALTAIDVNTGRFVGSVELAETVLTTNLQAADEVARQLRLRDLGGIIVVDFIDMDNPKHRQQVIKAFEEALKRDRAKIKVHNISALGLVEMTRKRTGESLVGLLTEPCPYCSGIGRVQNPITMALRIDREIAAAAVQAPATEAYLVTAHPRVVANMLGYEGEAHRDLEEYIGAPVYLRLDEQYHPNAYRIEPLTLEQALIAVPHLEDGEILEGQVANPDPEISLAPLVIARGIYIVVPDLDAPVGAHVKVQVRESGTSVAIGEPVAEELRGVRGDGKLKVHERPALVPESVLPAYLLDERAAWPPRSLSLLSPTAEAVPELVDAEFEAVTPAVTPAAPPVVAPAEPPRDRDRDRRRRKRRRRDGEVLEPEPAVAQERLDGITAPESEEALADFVERADEVLEAALPDTAATEMIGASSSRRRRRRRKRSTGRYAEGAAIPEGEDVLEVAPEGEQIAGEAPVEADTEAAVPEVVVIASEAAVEAQPEEAEAEEAAPSARRRTRGSRRRKSEKPAPQPVWSETAPDFNEITPDAAAEAMLSMLSAIPGETAPEEPEAAMAATDAAPAAEAPAPETTVEEAPVDTILVEEPTAEEAPVTEAPAEADTSADEVPTEETMVEAVPVESAPPARKRRTARPRKTAKASEDAAPVEQPEVVPVEATATAQVDAETPAEAVKPARKRAPRAPRRKTAVTEAEAPAE